MTRTERNEAPRALVKDRHSRAGLNKNETSRKQGAGAHNWGSFKDEGLYETQADADAAMEQGDDEGGVFEMDDGVGALPKKRHPNANDTAAEDEGLKIDPKEFTARADVIATSPSDSMSSLDSASANGYGKSGQRRMSNVSEEEREKARIYREGVRGDIKKGQGGLHDQRRLTPGVDLAHIAKTSYGIAQSPPGSFGTSPTKMK